MTTAHRPTYNPAKGQSGSGISQGGYLTGGRSYQFSVRDMPAHTKLKVRHRGQGTEDEVDKRDLLAELEAKERQHYEKLRREKNLLHGEGTAQAAKEAEMLRISNYPAGESGSGSESAAIGSQSDGLRQEELDVLRQFDDRDVEVVEDDSSSSSDDSDDDEDETAELMRELEQIKREREEEQTRRQNEEDELRRKEQEAAAIKGNPLLHLSSNGSQPSSAVVKRRWDDDVVFRNQAREDTKKKKRFVNDTIRNDFHRNFLSKYIQ